MQPSAIVFLFNYCKLLIATIVNILKWSLDCLWQG